MRSRLLITGLTRLPTNELRWLHKFVEFQDNAVYTVKWEQGHSSSSVLLNPKFAVLAQLSVEAFCDRYYGESLLTCASALDAYADFHIEVTMRSAGVKKTDVDALLKLTSKQAERRMGAFLTVEAAIRKTEPKWIDEKMVALRNKVVHQGYIPSRDKALEYMQHVMDFIIPRFAELHIQHQKIICKIFSEKASELPRGYGAMEIKTVIDGLAIPHKGTVKTLNEYIAMVEKKKSVEKSS